MKKLLTILTHVAYILSIALFVYVFFSQLADFLSIDILKFDFRLQTPEYLKILITTGLVSAFAGILLIYIQGGKITADFFAEDIKGKIVIILSSIFLSFFYVGSGQLTSIKYLLFFLGLFVFFVFFLPKVIWFLSNTNIRLEIDDKTTKTIKNTYIMLAISVCMIGAVCIVIINIAMSYLSGKAVPDLAQRENLYIQSVDSSVTTTAEPVTITGFNFGWKTSDSYKIMSSTGKINQYDWTNEHIRFIVPLDMKTGENEIWITRPQSESSHSLQQSNHVKIKVVDRFAFFPAENDSKWKRVLKRINRFMFLNVKIFNNILY